MTPPVATTLQRAMVAIVETTKATALKSPTNAFDMWDMQVVLPINIAPERAMPEGLFQKS